MVSSTNTVAMNLERNIRKWWLSYSFILCLFWILLVFHHPMRGKKDIIRTDGPNFLLLELLVPIGFPAFCKIFHSLFKKSMQVSHWTPKLNSHRRLPHGINYVLPLIFQFPLLTYMYKLYNKLCKFGDSTHEIMLLQLHLKLILYKQ